VEPLAAALVQTLSPDAVRGTRSGDRRVRWKGKTWSERKGRWDRGKGKRTRTHPGERAAQEREVQPMRFGGQDEGKKRADVRDTMRGKRTTIDRANAGSAEASRELPQGSSQTARIRQLHPTGTRPNTPGNFIQTRRKRPNRRDGVGNGSSRSEEYPRQTDETSLTDAERPPTNTCT